MSLARLLTLLLRLPRVAQPLNTYLMTMSTSELSTGIYTAPLKLDSFDFWSLAYTGNHGVGVDQLAMLVM